MGHKNLCNFFMNQINLFYIVRAQKGVQSSPKCQGTHNVFEHNLTPHKMISFLANLFYYVVKLNIILFYMLLDIKIILNKVKLF